MWLIVDGANVVGSRPDGWWRDPAGAASRLAERLDRAERAGALRSLRGEPDRPLIGSAGRETPGSADQVRPAGRVTLVLEGRAKRAELPPGLALDVLLAPRDGDSAIVELAHEITERGENVQVVTADRELTRLLAAVGAGTVRPGALLRALDSASP